MKVLFLILFTMLISILFIDSFLFFNSIKKIIEKEGYFYWFNDVDKKVRNGLTLETFLNKCRRINVFDYIYLKKCGIPPQNIIIFHKSHEGGNPHTHGRFIFLPSDYKTRFTPERLKTIINHENIHIFQRYFPCDASKAAEIMFNCHIVGFQKFGPIKYRSNPDINKILYSNITNEYMDNASKLGDLKDKNDHPYEMMAYRYESKNLSV